MSVCRVINFGYPWQGAPSGVGGLGALENCPVDPLVSWPASGSKDLLITANLPLSTVPALETSGEVHTGFQFQDEVGNGHIRNERISEGTGILRTDENDVETWYNAAVLQPEPGQLTYSSQVVRYAGGAITSPFLSPIQLPAFQPRKIGKHGVVRTVSGYGTLQQALRYLHDFRGGLLLTDSSGRRGAAVEYHLRVESAEIALACSADPSGSGLKVEFPDTLLWNISADLTVSASCNLSEGRRHLASARATGQLTTQAPTAAVLLETIQSQISNGQWVTKSTTWATYHMGQRAKLAYEEGYSIAHRYQDEIVWEWMEPGPASVARLAFNPSSVAVAGAAHVSEFSRMLGIPGVESWRAFPLVGTVGLRVVKLGSQIEAEIPGCPLKVTAVDPLFDRVMVPALTGAAAALEAGAL